MKKISSLIAATALLTAAHAARAADPAPEPGWSDLPVAAPLAPPRKAPARIGGGERVEGLAVRSAGGGGEYAMVEARTPEDAPRNVELCITAPEDGRQHMMFGPTNEPATRWDDGGQSTVHLSRQQGVSAFRAEQIGEKAGQPIVTTWTFFADPVTLGARLVDKREISIRLVKETKVGVKIYAARDAASVHAFILSPREMGELTGFQFTAERASGVTSHSNGCRLGHVTLSAEKGKGEATSVRATVLAGTEPEKRPPPEPGEETPLVPGSDAQELVRARFRTAVYHLGTTFLASDLQPVFTVSVGWDGRERSVVTMRQKNPQVFPTKRFRK